MSSLTKQSNEWKELLSKLNWRFTIFLALLHIAAVKGFLILLTEAKWPTVFTLLLTCNFSPIYFEPRSQLNFLTNRLSFHNGNDYWYVC